MESIVNEKSCENCRYYLNHYINQTVRYNFVGYGKCINCKNKHRRKLKSLIACEYWEDISIIEEKRKKAIQETLALMSKSFDKIAVIFNNDEEGGELTH